MKKILMVCEAFEGGVFSYLVDLVNGLTDRYDIYIAYAVRPHTPQNVREYFNKNVYLIKMKNLTRTIQARKDILAFFEIRKIAKEVKPDIIHLHSSKAGALGRWAFSGRKTSVFYTPHGYSFLMKNHSAVKRFAYKMIETVSGRRHCTTISCGEGEHQETLKLTKRAICVENGINIIDLEKALDSVRRTSSDQFTVFTLGRICAQKNPTLFNKIAEKLPEVRFLWIGDGELRGELNAPNIEITGWMDRKDALSYSLSGDVFILTSLWEGAPISLLEAMFMMKPCVVSDVIGNHDIIHNGNNGYVCNEISDYVNAIGEVKSGNSTKLVDEAHKDILNKYNTKVMVEKYSAIYDKACENTGNFLPN
ncbi:MAG: glycosyltransferase [Lachnospiraceae bacterium]|nr:glycosyltransferase [Lachnospiraceae bacterium]